MWWRRFSFSFLGLLLFTACNRHPDAKKIPVLTVNGQIFTAAEVGKVLAQRLKTYDALAAKDPLNVKRARESLLRELIISALLTQYAADHKIVVTDDEKTKEFDRVRKSYPDDLTFRASLASEGQTVDEWKKRLSQSLLERKAFQELAPITSAMEKQAEPEARKYYENHHGEFDRPAEIHLQQILVAKEDDAERISHALKAGGVSFGEMAKKYSLSPDAVDGGDVGFLAKGSVAAFDAAFGLKPGQVTGVIKSSYGFHIMKVLDRRPAGHLPFEKVKARLVRQVTGQKQQTVFDQWLEGAVKAAKIERNDTLLDRIRVRTEAEDE